MAKKDKDKRNPEPPIVLRDVLAGKPELIVHTADLTVTARAREITGATMQQPVLACRQAGTRHPGRRRHSHDQAIELQRDHHRSA
jgi:hypothetical protein